MMNSNCNLVVNNNVITKIKNLVIFLSLASIVCLFGFSCERDVKKDNLPPITTIGASTMSFSVDGVPWITHSDDFKLSKTRAKYYISIGIAIYGVNHPKSRLEMTLKNPKTGKYQFTTDDAIEYSLYNNPSPFNLDITDPSNSLVIMRYDGAIISGKFSFKLKSPDGAIRFILQKAGLTC